MVFIDINAFITEGRNFKAFLKEIHAIALVLLWIDVTYLIKKNFNMELNMMLMKLMEFAYISHSLTLH